MKQYTRKDLTDIEKGISELVAQRAEISRKIFRERQKLYNHRKYLKRKIAKQ